MKSLSLFYFKEMEPNANAFSVPVNIVPVSQNLVDTSKVQQQQQQQQQSVIQSSQQQQLQQQLQSMHDSELNDDESKKRRDILTRRPSYRYAHIPIEIC